MAKDDHEEFFESTRKQYFNDANLFGRVLRLFNLLEPGHMVLSLSKLAMWGAFGLVVYVLIYQQAELLNLLGVLGTFLGSTGNYMYRRYTQIQQGSGSMSESPFGEEPFE